MTTPHYIGDVKSDMRGIKPGWYAIEDDGNLSSGPFSSREQCVDSIARPKNGAKNGTKNGTTESQLSSGAK